MQRRTVLSGHEAADSHLSYDLWRDAPLADAILDPTVGTQLHEDFTCFGGPVAANVGSKAGRSGMWKTYEDTGVSLEQLAVSGGVLGYTGTTTDNFEANMQSGYGTGCPFKLELGKKLWFETQVEKEAVGDTLGFMVGLASAAATGNNLMADAGNDIADISFLGFISFDADGDVTDFVYQKATQAFVKKQDATTPILTGMVAATKYNLGFKHDGRGVITPWVNGRAKKPYMLPRSVFDATTTFPSGLPLSVLFGVKQGTNVAQYVRCTGITCLQANN